MPPDQGPGHQREHEAVQEHDEHRVVADARDAHGSGRDDAGRHERRRDARQQAGRGHPDPAQLDDVDRQRDHRSEQQGRGCPLTAAALDAEPERRGEGRDAHDLDDEDGPRTAQDDEEVVADEEDAGGGDQRQPPEHLARRSPLPAVDDLDDLGRGHAQGHAARQRHQRRGATRTKSFRSRSGSCCRRANMAGATIRRSENIVTGQLARLKAST